MKIINITNNTKYLKKYIALCYLEWSEKEKELTEYIRNISKDSEIVDYIKNDNEGNAIIANNEKIKEQIEYYKELSKLRYH